jgi:hypothetical protein
VATLFKKANKFLRAGQYSNAIDIYNTLLTQQSHLESLIKFNLELAKRRLIKIDEKKSFLHQNIQNSIFMSHEVFQSPKITPSLILGGLVVGYPEKNTKLIPQRIIECIEFFSQIAQIPDWHRLHLLTGEKLIRSSCESLISSPSTFVHSFMNMYLRLSSIWYSNSRDLRVSIEKITTFEQGVTLRAYQYDSVVGGGLVLVCEYLLQAEEYQIADLLLANPYFPILLTLSNSEGYLLDAALIPYPSLLPGGVHEHECYIDDDFSKHNPSEYAKTLLLENRSALEKGWALGMVQVDIREAIGTEFILLTDFKEWLWSVFSLRIKPWHPSGVKLPLVEYWQDVFTLPSSIRSAEKFSKQALRERDGQTLLCPPRAIPSLRALTMSSNSGTLEQTCGLSEFVFVQDAKSINHSQLSWPQLAINLERTGVCHVPRVLLGKDDVSKQTVRTKTGVSAILFGKPSEENILNLIMPTALDFYESNVQIVSPYLVDIIVTINNISEEIFAAFLESLLLQCHIKIRQIVMIMPYTGSYQTFDLLLRRDFGGKYQLLLSSEGDNYKLRVQRATDAIKDQTDDVFMFFINQPLILHNSFTIYALVQALAPPQIVTASTFLITNIEKKSKLETVIWSGGIFPVSIQGQNKIEYRKKNLISAIPGVNLPVASHSDALYMIKAKDWKKSGGFSDLDSQNEHAIFEYSNKLFFKNKLHMLISNVSVELHLNEIIGNEVDVCWFPPEEDYVSTTAVHIKVLS